MASARSLFAPYNDTVMAIRVSVTNRLATHQAALATVSGRTLVALRVPRGTQRQPSVFDSSDAIRDLNRKTGFTARVSFQSFVAQPLLA
jgi:hypothetical protein